MKTVVHVNRQTIARNVRHGTNEPPIIVRTYKGTRHAHEVAINGVVRVVHRSQPLSCGARVWIETEAHVEILK